MSDNGDNPILEHLRGLRGGQDRIESEWREIGASQPQSHTLDLWVRDLTAL